MKNNLRVLMAERKINSISELSLITGINRNTLSNIYHEKNTRIDYKTISRLCQYLDCTPNDLILIEKREGVKS